jgi:hypothetical protein
MILAVIIDGEGRPICTEMLPGNTADATVGFLVGLSGKRSPHQFYGGQPQLGEEQRDAGRVTGIGCSHAASTSWTVLSSS